MKLRKEKDLSIRQNQKKWEREEVVLLVVEYYRIRYLPHNEQKKSIIRISQVLRNRALKKGEIISDIFRNANGISMQMACLKSLDPDVDSGLKGTSKIQKEIMLEYQEKPDLIKSEAEIVLRKYQ